VTEPAPIVTMRVGWCWKPKLCPLCGWPMWLNLAFLVERGPDAENGYHMGCVIRSVFRTIPWKPYVLEVFKQEDRWAADKNRDAR
jgi:hypothetical protein